MRKNLFYLGLVVLLSGLYGKEYYAWDFSDCEIKDILFAVSMDTGISIVADDTVYGKGDLRYSGSNFSEGFDAFLNGSRLFVSKKENLWTVSKFRFERSENSYSVDAYDLCPEQIVERISRELDSVITYDVLPAQKMSVHFKNLKEKELVESLGKQFGAYEIVEGKNSFSFVHKNEVKKLNSADSYVRITTDGFGLATLDVKNVNFNDVVEKMFQWNFEKNNDKKSFCFIDGGEVKTCRVVFSGKSFDELLYNLCKQNGFSYEVVNDVYYLFFSGERKDELIYGQRSWNFFELKYIDVQNFLPLVLKNIGSIETSVYPGNKNGFYGKVNKSEQQQIIDLIRQIDIAVKTHVVNLKYIKPSVFMEHLPPFVEKDCLYLADDDSCLYFKGTEAEYENLCQQLEVCDRPEKRITYDLLILQYEESKQNDWAANFNTGMVNMGDRTSASAQLGSIFNLNMNIVSAFGVEFAAKLQSSIEENATKVFVDTTLHGISGKEINFQNTNTYRYRDNNLDPETGKPVYTGVTKEIISGIKLDILGWVSGDGNITSKVKASVSRQGIDTSTSTGNPPSTSEKIVTTEISTKSGEPVILSGLVQDSSIDGETRLPGFSKIPFIGKLFKAETKIKEKNQIVIYLVPHLDDLEENDEKNDFELVVNKCNEIVSLL